MPADQLPSAVSGYRRELARAARQTGYLRVFFSVLLLLYAGLGPGLLGRFPGSAGGVGFDPVSRFYAFRPALFALGFVAVACVLAALARRAADLFALGLAEDESERTASAERERYIRHLHPSPLPFVLSGQLLVDLLVLVVALGAFAFWVLLLVETIPAGLGGYRVAGVVLGAYGAFSTVIIFAFVWFGLAERRRRLRRRLEPPQA